MAQILLATASLKVGHNYMGTGSYLLSVQWMDDEPTMRTMVLHFVLRGFMLEPMYSMYVHVKLQWNIGI